MIASRTEGDGTKGMRMRPALKPPLRCVWRGEQTLQIGLDGERATVLAGVDEDLLDVLTGLVGDRVIEEVVADAEGRGIAPARTRRMLELLTDAGVLDDGDQPPEAFREVGPIETERLGPDLAAASLVSGRLDGGDHTMARRRRAHLVVHGAGRVGASVASLLTAAGVGQVSVFDRQTTQPGDMAPAGLSAEHLGMSRGAAADARLRQLVPAGRSAAGSPAARSGRETRPDLVVLTPDEEVDRRLSSLLVRDGIAHLVARVQEIRGIVGPLVIPGTTSCLRCHDLYRLERDPGWQAVVDEVETRQLPIRAGDVVLASTVAGLTALHALAFLDEEVPPSVDGTVELTLPFGTARRRSWYAHPHCGCQWSHLASPSVDGFDTAAAAPVPAQSSSTTAGSTTSDEATAA